MSTEDYAQGYSELAEFLAGYFHQDWSFLLGSHDWRKVVQQYCADTGIEFRRVAIRELDALIGQGLTEVSLRAAFESIDTNYYPPGAGLTYADWLQQVRDELASCAD